jgi:hypothetical protein
MPSRFCHALSWLSRYGRCVRPWRCRRCRLRVAVPQLRFPPENIGDAVCLSHRFALGHQVRTVMASLVSRSPRRASFSDEMFEPLLLGETGHLGD